MLDGGTVSQNWGVAASPEGGSVVTTGHGGGVRLWDARTLRLEETLHIELERRQLGTTQGGATYIEPLAREALILDAGSFGIEEDEARFTVHNFTARVASARVDAGPWSEQVQLMKLNGNWQIVNSFVL